MTALDFAHVFCHDGAGGNPTGLVLDASALSTDEMQALAQQCGHESGFVLPPADGDKADFRFRYFVPRHEMEMCGHATVGGRPVGESQHQHQAERASHADPSPQHPVIRTA